MMGSNYIRTLARSLKDMMQLRIDYQAQQIGTEQKSAQQLLCLGGVIFFSMQVGFLRSRQVCRLTSFTFVFLVCEMCFCGEFSW